jgi:hypothetical protein
MYSLHNWIKPFHSNSIGSLTKSYLIRVHLVSPDSLVHPVQEATQVNQDLKDPRANLLMPGLETGAKKVNIIFKYSIQTLTLCK